MLVQTPVPLWWSILGQRPVRSDTRDGPHEVPAACAFVNAVPCCARLSNEDFIGRSGGARTSSRISIRTFGRRAPGGLRPVRSATGGECSVGIAQSSRGHRRGSVGARARRAYTHTRVSPVTQPTATYSRTYTVLVATSYSPRGARSISSITQALLPVSYTHLTLPTRDDV